MKTITVTMMDYWEGDPDRAVLLTLSPDNIAGIQEFPNGDTFVILKESADPRFKCIKVRESRFRLVDTLGWSIE